jgi:hypothetical protein
MPQRNSNLLFIAGLILILPLSGGQSDIAGSGNITYLNFYAENGSNCWAGFYGEVSTGPNYPLTLNASGGNITNVDISLDVPLISDYLIISNSSVAPYIPALVAGDISHIDAFTSTSESGSNTFIYLRDYILASTNFSDVSTAFPLVGGSQQISSFMEGFFENGSTLVFTPSVESDLMGYDDETHDYQLILPVPCGGNMTYHIHHNLSYLPAVVEEEEELKKEKGPAEAIWYLFVTPTLPRVNITVPALLDAELILGKKIVEPLEILPITLVLNYTGDYEIRLRAVVNIEAFDLSMAKDLNLRPNSVRFEDFDMQIPGDAEEGNYTVIADILFVDRKADLSGNLQDTFIVRRTPPAKYEPYVPVVTQLEVACNCFGIACFDTLLLTIFLTVISEIIIGLGSLRKHHIIGIEEVRRRHMYAIFIIAIFPILLIPLALCMAFVLSFVDLICSVIYWLSVVPGKPRKKKREPIRDIKKEAAPRKKTHTDNILERGRRLRGFGEQSLQEPGDM